MHVQQWERIKALFQAALDRDPSERDAFLSAACKENDGDALALRAEVDRLLAAHDQAGNFIEAPLIDEVNFQKRRVGRYDVERLLGTGGMGEVYLARDTELGRNVALKLATNNDRDAHARLRREAQHASHLNHPHICTIYEVGLHDGQPFIAMEYIEGRLLSDLIRPRGLPVDLVTRYGMQMADAVSHAHAHGMTHRDLKSANIIITPDDRAKVLDFGIARRLAGHRVKDVSASKASITAEGVLVGTLACMAPEVLRGEPADERSDLWALGVLLYEMSVGKPPFTGVTGIELTAAILQGSPAPLPGHVPPSLAATIHRCLEKDSRRRWQSANDLRAALDRVQQELTQRVSPRWLNTRVAAVVALIAAASVLTVAGWRWRPHARPVETVAAPVAVSSSGHPAIAVMSFDVAGAAEPDIGWLSSGVPSMLLTGLAQTRGLDLVSRRRLTDAARQIGVTNLDSLDRSQAAEVARRAGASAVVVGTIFQSGGELRIDAQMEDLASGRVLVAEGVRGADVFTLVDQLASRFRHGVGLANAQGVRSITAVSSPSLDAYRLFVQGTEAFQNVRRDEATRLLGEAVRVDPEFASAHLYLGLAHYFTGNDVARQRHFARAHEHAERLSERQRLLLRAEMARDAGNGAEAERLLDQLLAEFPDWHDGYASALELYAVIPGLVLNPEKRLTIVGRSVDAQPTAALPRNVYGYALLEASRFKQALDQFDTYARLSPQQPNPYDSIGEVHLAMGLPEKGLEYYARALAIDPSFYQSHTGRAVGLAMLGRFDAAMAEETTDLALKAFLLMRSGRYRAASETIEMGIKRSVENDSIVGQSTGAFMSSLAALEERQYARALGQIDHARRILAPLPRERQRVYLVLADLMAGLAYVRAGQLDRARERLDSQTRLYRAANPFEKGWHAALAGEIALADKRLADAAAAFASGEPATRVWTALYLDYPWALMNDIPARDGMARVAKARGDIAGAVQIYRRLLVAGPEQKWPALFDPRYVLEIAQLLEQSGDRKAALVEYQRFLELWNNADSNLPQLAEARRAVGRLRAN